MKHLFTLLALLNFLFASEDVFKIFEDSQNEDKYFEIGKKYYKENDLQNAFINFEKAAKFGHKKAQYNLGILYSNKKFVNYDRKKAYEVFFNLAQQDYAPAQNRVGMHYVLGEVIEKDYKKAVEYFEKASKQGHISAQCNLASMYASGRGVFKNFGRAHVFAKEGYTQGNPICKKVWKDYNLEKFPEDKSFKFGSYTKP